LKNSNTQIPPSLRYPRPCGFLFGDGTGHPFIPTFFFINKTDRETVNVNAVLKQLREDLTPDLCDITNTFKDIFIKNDLIEFLAEKDEKLLESYLSGKNDNDFWLNAIKRLIQQNRFFPCSHGSALHDTGVIEFLKKLDRLTDTNYSTIFWNRIIVGSKVGFEIKHDTMI